jgi:hypothetical protein
MSVMRDSINPCIHRRPFPEYRVILYRKRPLPRRLDSMKKIYAGSQKHFDTPCRIEISECMIFFNAAMLRRNPKRRAEEHSFRNTCAASGAFHRFCHEFYHSLPVGPLLVVELRPRTVLRVADCSSPDG